MFRGSCLSMAIKLTTSVVALSHCVTRYVVNVDDSIWPVIRDIPFNPLIGIK